MSARIVLYAPILDPVVDGERHPQRTFRSIAEAFPASTEYACALERPAPKWPRIRQEMGEGLFMAAVLGLGLWAWAAGYLFGGHP